MDQTKTLTTTVISTLKDKTIAIIITVVASVVLPMVCHLIGSATGFGASLGTSILPMHFTVILLAFLAGPAAGFIAGTLSPIISYFLTGMPAPALLPFMTIELALYGFTGGFLSGTKIPSVPAVLLTQIAGRAVRALALFVAISGFGFNKLPLSIIWTSITAGIPGIIAQLVLIPMILYFVEKGNNV